MKSKKVNKNTVTLTLTKQEAILLGQMVGDISAHEASLHVQAVRDRNMCDYKKAYLKPVSDKERTEMGKTLDKVFRNFLPLFQQP